MLPLSPLKGLKMQNSCFTSKSALFSKEVYYKVSLCEIIGSKVVNVRHHNQTALISLMKLHDKLQTRPTV